MAGKLVSIGGYQADHKGPFAMWRKKYFTKVSVMFTYHDSAFVLVEGCEKPIVVNLSKVYCAQEEVKPVEGWVNIYKESMGCFCKSKEEAELYAERNHGLFVRTVHLREVMPEDS